MSKIAEVILDDAIDRSLDYAIPEHIEGLEIGMRVEVPLRGRSAKGTLFALKEASAFAKVKPLTKILSEEVAISSSLFKLALWMAKYYCCPLGKVLKTILPPSIRDEKGQHKTQSFVKPLLSLNRLRDLCLELQEKHPAQAKVLELLLKSPKGLFLSEILEMGSLSRSPIQTLAKKNVLRLQNIQVDRSELLDQEFFPTKPKTLTDEQKKTLDAILKSCSNFQTHLIHGVTGSGKTEIYLQAIEKILDQGQGIIYLVPEIALTSQTIERFKGRFGTKQIAILHHRLSKGERFDAWHKIRKGTAKIIIGARSAIFSPVPNLGMIIVDEEQETSYKQSEEAPKYHARDIAVVRGKQEKCPVILGSATPSLESYSNALDGKYQLHILKKRPQSALLPKVKLIDMKREFERAKGYTLFSEPLIDGIKKRIESGEQTLLFLNRRGYHTSAGCPQCSYIINCPHCDLSLTYHLSDKILACHLCDYHTHPPRSCPDCGADGPLKFRGAGTEMVQRALHALFPTVRSLRLDADTTKHKGSHEKLFKEFRSGKADVLIGTQMIAKGLHFPLVTLVGVLAADGSLHIPDFRASENVFQLITQVAGRSGRGELPGEVLIQTHLPRHPTIQQAASQDYETFYKDEIEVRKAFSFPPFTHLVKFSFSGANQIACEKEANVFRQELVQSLPKEAEILPVVACGYAKIKGNYRYQCLVKIEKIPTILGQIEKLRTSFRKKGGLRLSIDVDPLSTFF